MLREILGRDGAAKGVRAGRDISAYEAFMGFYHAVTWSDPGVAAILCFHILYAIACSAACWLPVEAQGAMFLLTCGLVYAASSINAYLAHTEGRVPRWSTHGFTQNYFDKQGVFMAHVYCAPLLLIAFAQMVSVTVSSLPARPFILCLNLSLALFTFPLAALYSLCCLQASSEGEASRVKTKQKETTRGEQSAAFLHSPQNRLGLFILSILG